MESLRGNGVSCPIAEKGSLWLLLAEEVLSNHGNADSSGTEVLLGAGVDDTVVRPVDGSGAEVGGHVADNGLTLGSLPIEASELKTLDGLVFNIVEEGSIVGDFPLT